MNFTADIINFIGNTTFINVVEVTLNVTTDAEIQGDLNVGGNINMSSLAGGDGSSYICVDANGQLFTQEGAC